MTLLVRPEAQHDIREAALRYEEKQAGLGLNFVATIEQAFERIASGPDRFARAHHGLR